MAKVRDIQWNLKRQEGPFVDPLPALNDDEINLLLENIDICPIMAIRPPFSEKFVRNPKTVDVDVDDMNLEVINLYLISLFHAEYEGADLEYLRKIASTVYLHYSEDELEFIEAKTRDQAKSLLWYRFRAGRVTASKFKRVCCTNLQNPSVSLVLDICFPEEQQFYSKYTEYGKKNEDTARNDYITEVSSKHDGFTLIKCGLVMHNSYPHCGASPDGMMGCYCCGSGCLEIKCPWSFKNDNLRAYLSRSDCPIKEVDNEFVMNTKHEYFYQVQMQMFVLDVDYCDFVVWNKKRVLIARTFKDNKFWNEEYPKTEEFFKQVLLPELLGCYYSNQKREKLKSKKKG